MGVVDWLSDDATKAWIVAVAPAIGAILAWATKLKWAEEYKKAIEAKMALAETQISLLEKNTELSEELNKERVTLAQEQVACADQKYRNFAQDIPETMRILFSDQKVFYEKRIESLNKTIDELNQALLAK